MPPTVPAQISKYRVLDLIGEGAMGIVYRAEDTVLNRIVAVKIMNESIAKQDDLRDRFLREAQLAGSLTHPNVVTVYDFGETDGHLFIAMEYVPGIDLETALLRRDPLKLQAKLEIVIDVLHGLAYAHKRGIVHRDVKPANIRITEDGRAKLMDFGVAHLSASTITRTGEQMGTPSYMAPEQITGGRVSPASDIFAVGSMLYELLSGSKPFAGPTLHSVMYKIVSEEPTPIAEIIPGIPSSLEQIVTRALAKDLAQRYVSAFDMAAALTEVRAGLSGPAVTSTLSLRRTMIAAPGARPRRRVPALVLAAAVVVAFAGGLAWRTRDASAPAVASNARLDSAPPSAPNGPPNVSPGVLPNAAPNISRPAAAPPAAAPRPVGRTTGASTATPAATPDAPAPRLADVASSAASTAASSAALSPVPGESSPPAPAPVAAPAVSPTSSSAAADPARIPDAIAAYARAIESRDLGELRQAYPGLTTAQARSFAQFFEATRSMKVTLAISGLDVTGANADARLAGSYEFVTTAGKSERQPVTFHAALRHDGTRWRLVSVR